MALLYPWATKDYLLWHMSMGQIILYYNMGMEQKYGKSEKEPNTLAGKSHDELKRIRDEMIAEGLIPSKAELERKYGDITDE